MIWLFAILLFIGLVLIGVGAGVLSTGACVKWDKNGRERISYPLTLLYTTLLWGGIGLVVFGCLCL